MAVTIKDIAAAAGVSPSTVSRTCKDSPSISRDTKERIRRIMAQMGYEPNFEAEPSEAFSKTIGIILPSSQRDVYENAFHLEIIRGIGQFCNQRRYVNTVITGEDDAEVLDAIQSMVANTQADGFILLYSKKIVRWLPICAARVCFTLSWAKQRSRPTRPSISTTTTHWRARKPPTISTRWDIAASPILGSAMPCCFLPSGNAAIGCLCSSTASPRGKGLCGDRHPE